MTLTIDTPRLRLALADPEETREMLDGLSDDDRAQLSANWLALVAQATTADPWVHGFRITRLSDETYVGDCGFKGPPVDATVEIAYGIQPDHQSQGYATEAAAALWQFAASQPGVCCVRAHTLPEPNASTRVLTKCGFTKIGEVADPDDGQVWRWEKPVDRD